MSQPIEHYYDVRAVALRLAAIKAIKDVILDTEKQAKVFMASLLDPGDRKHAVTADGHSVATISYVQGVESLKVVNEAQFLAWVKERRPTAVVETVRDSDKRSILDEAARTGEIPLGVMHVVSQGHIQVRQTPDQREQLLSYESGEVLDLAMSFEAPAIEGPTDEEEKA